MPSVPEPLLTLAPLHLPNRRRVRYVGDDYCVDLPQLAKPDQALIFHLYRNLTALLFALSNPSNDDAGKWQRSGALGPASIPAEKLVIDGVA